LLGEELTRQSCSCRATQLLPGENKNISEHLAQTRSELPQASTVTCPVDRSNQVLLTSQSLGETISEFPLVKDGP
jgi:elongation factor P--beta-lysine ligase